MTGLPELAGIRAWNIAGVRLEVDPRTAVARVDLGDMTTVQIRAGVEREIARTTRNCVRVEVVGTVPAAIRYLVGLIPAMWELYAPDPNWDYSPRDVA